MKGQGECSVIFCRSPVSLVINLCWLNLTSQCLVWHGSILLLSEMIFLLINCLIPSFEHFLEASHNLRIINGLKNISGEKQESIPPSQNFQGMRSRHVLLLVFDKTLAQLHFSVVNCSDKLRSAFYSPVLTRRLIFFAVTNCCIVALGVRIFFR